MAGRDKFADAVADHRGRLDAPVTPEIGEGIFDDEDGGLGEHGVLQLIGGGFEIGAVGRIEDLGQAESEERLKDRRAMIDEVPETRLGFVEDTPHVDMLGALSGEKEMNRGIAAFGEAAHPIAGGESGGERFKILRRDGTTAAERLASDREGPCDVGGGDSSGSGGKSGEIFRSLRERFPGPGREEEKLMAARRVRRGNHGRFLEDDVRIRPAHAEGTDAGAARLSGPT